MKRHGHPFEQVVVFDNLVAAARRALRGKTRWLAVGIRGIRPEPPCRALAAGGTGAYVPS